MDEDQSFDETNAYLQNEVQQQNNEYARKLREDGHYHEDDENGGLEEDEDEDEDEDDEDESEELQNFDALYRKVSKNNILTKTRCGYHGSMARFVVWAQKSEPDLLHNELSLALSQIANDNSLNSKKKGKKLRDKALKFIKKGSEDFHPINFENMTVQKFVHFLFSRVDSTGSKFLSKSGYGGYRSALKEMYMQCKVKQSEEFQEELSSIFKCLNRSYQEEKDKKGGRMAEGKDPMPFQVYKLLCRWMIEDNGSEAIFGHAFLTLTWNLMCRSINTTAIHRKHMSWEGDSLGIQFAHMKTDKEGFDSMHKRHVYANPFCVEICAITATAKYLLFNPKSQDDKLFDGNSYQRFRKYLKKLVNDHKDEIVGLGIDPAHIGVHSIRKGAATYCCCGTTSAPSIAAICVRAGWTMGKVRDRYIRYEAAGDQHVGRVVAGLDVLNAKFACTPPYFCIQSIGEMNNNNASTDEQSTCTEADIVKVMNTVFTCELVTTFIPVARACLASLCFAMNTYLHLLPHRNCPVRTNPLFMNVNTDATIKTIVSAVKVSHPWQECKYWDGVPLTGIPSYIQSYVGQQVTNELCKEGVRQIIVKFDDMQASFKKELDGRGIGGGSLTMSLIQSQFLGPMMGQFKNLTERMNNIENASRSDTTGTTQNINNSTSLEQGQDPNSLLFPMYKWSTDGPFHQGRQLPEKYNIPSMTLLNLWHHWHHPSQWIELDDTNTVKAEHRIRPLKLISRLSDIKNTRSLSRARMVCNLLDNACNINAKAKSPSHEILNKLFHSTQSIKDTILPDAMTKSNRKRSRVSEFTWGTVARNYEEKHKKKKARTETAEEEDEDDPQEPQQI